MAICGNCGITGTTVQHVKACYSTVLTETAPQQDFSGFVEKFVENLDVLPVAQAHAKTVDDFKPMALATNVVPDSKYAVMRSEGPVFYEVRTGKKGKWAGFQFVDRLVGHPGDWLRFPVKAQARKNILHELALDPKESALLFSRTFVVCAACNAPLSDPDSLARGFGPICVEKFA